MFDNDPTLMEGNRIKVLGDSVSLIGDESHSSISDPTEDSSSPQPKVDHAR